MRAIELLKTIPLYLNYYLNAVDEHSLQAPFVYQFYESLKQKLPKNHGDPDIENLRKKLLNDTTLLKVQDEGAGSRKNRKNAGKTISQIAKYEISSWKKCAFLQALIQQGGYSNCIELGTSLGITTAYLSRGCANGNIFTFEADVFLCKKATDHLALLGCKNVQIIQGKIDQTLAPFLENNQRIDCAFIDANHTGQALERYFTWLVSHISENSLIIIDDIRWSIDMNKSWKKLLKHPVVSVSLEFREIGILFINTRHTRQHYVLENPH
ncbi:MAG: class I SAM-dependent methyltransferase [Cyclobacteriaceae bacterium]|nr:class I SAM-dependent methyltransferase [Cyclobacteriaceae bacterium]